MLTTDELAFLEFQNLSADDVYDGRNQSSARWKAGVQAAGLTLVLGTACRSAGHRLRSRAGHCAQCDTSKLSYQGRHYSTGYVYIAGSLSARLLKIGTTTEIEQRHRTLREQAYGSIHDWEMLFYARVESAGKIEGKGFTPLAKLQDNQNLRKERFGPSRLRIASNVFLKGN